MNDNENTLLTKVVKSVLYTLFMVLVSMRGIYLLVNLVFTNMSVEQSSTWIIICMCIGIIFTIFFCTLTILDEIKRKG